MAEAKAYIVIDEISLKWVIFYDLDNSRTNFIE